MISYACVWIVRDHDQEDIKLVCVFQVIAMNINWFTRLCMHGKHAQMSTLIGWHELKAFGKARNLSYVAMILLKHMHDEDQKNEYTT